MLEFVLSWLPCIWALLILWISKLQPIWRFLLALFIYLVVMVAIAIALPVMDQFDSGNAKVIAGAISEGIITGILRMFIDVPIMGAFLWFISRPKDEA